MMILRISNERWLSCTNSEWMIGHLGSLCGDNSEQHKQLVWLACQCARLSLKYIPVGESRPRIAIETAEAWVKGREDIDSVMVAVIKAQDFFYEIADENATAFAAAEACLCAARCVFARSNSFAFSTCINCVAHATYCGTLDILDTLDSYYGDEIEDADEIADLYKRAMSEILADTIRAYVPNIEGWQNAIL